MKQYKIWLLRLIPPANYGGILSAITIFSTTYLFFNLGNNSASIGQTPALFFSLILAYIIPMFSFVTHRIEGSLHELRPILKLSDSEFNRTLRRLNSASILRMLTYVTIGLISALIHLSLIYGSVSIAVTNSVSHWNGLTIMVGTCLVWTVMTFVIYTLVQQSITFSRLGKYHTKISLLNKRNLVPFARVSITSSLVLIGAIALYPFMWSDGQIDYEEALPGLIAVIIPLIFVYLMPVWPIHRHLADLKLTELDKLDQEIANNLDDYGNVSHAQDNLNKLMPLLNYRQEIAKLNTWPFDMSAVTRLTLYLIIPPITWVGAALIENIIDPFL